MPHGVLCLDVPLPAHAPRVGGIVVQSHGTQTASAGPWTWTLSQAPVFGNRIVIWGEVNGTTADMMNVIAPGSFGVTTWARCKTWQHTNRSLSCWTGIVDGTPSTTGTVTPSTTPGNTGGWIAVEIPSSTYQDALSTGTALSPGVALVTLPTATVVMREQVIIFSKYTNVSQNYSSGPTGQWTDLAETISNAGHLAYQIVDHPSGIYGTTYTMAGTDTFEAMTLVFTFP